MEKYLGNKLTVNLTEDLHDRMKKFPEIRWATVARGLVTKYVEKLEKGEDVHSWTNI
jgi:hypothetical protein